MSMQKGFTLIEIIVTLLLVGIIAAVAGLGIVEATKGYVFAKSNSSYAQKGQIAMARISRELMELTDITAASSNSVTYKRLSGTTTNPSVITQTIAFSSTDNKIRLTDNAGNVYDLIDDVSNFALTFYQGSSSWSIDTSDPEHIKLLSGIKVDVTLLRKDGGSNIAFSTVINPRNNSNAGGTLPPSPTTQPQYKACFIATAAFGNIDDPKVEILRHFRDHFMLQNGLGKLFINFYYTIGPYVADYIKDKEWACITTQILLAPIVGIAASMLYVPVSAWLIIFFTAWVLSYSTIYVVRRKRGTAR